MRATVPMCGWDSSNRESLPAAWASDGLNDRGENPWSYDAATIDMPSSVICRAAAKQRKTHDFRTCYTIGALLESLAIHYFQSPSR